MAVAVERDLYSELSKIIKGHGLLDKQYGYYWAKITQVLCCLCVSLIVLAFIDSFWLQCLNAVFLGFVFTQLGLLAHDAGHQQIFASSRKNYIVMLVAGFFIGLCPTWWQSKHDNHHANPNNLDEDWDINLPFIAFTEKQALAKRGIYRLAVKFQHIIVWFLMPFEAVSIRLDSAQYFIGHRGRSGEKYIRILEPGLLLAHIAAYIPLLFLLDGWWQMLLFGVIHQATVGLYMASVFAPNHKGMLLVDNATQIDRLCLQVLTARNIKGNWFFPQCLVNLYYGGLGFQVEHHLFPWMPRNNLGKARTIVRQFCQSNGVKYYETSALRSFYEIYRTFRDASAVLREREPRRPKAAAA